MARPPALLAWLYATMLAVSWRRWMTPIADSGRELDLPRRLLEGELLYRDVHYLYPPLAPYLKALLFRVFGLELAVLQGLGAVGSLLIVWMIWRIARRLTDEWGAGVATGAVIVLCLFKPTGSMISPYSYAGLCGTVFSLAALLAGLRYVESGREDGQTGGGWLVVAGVLTGLAGISKQEFGLAAAVAVVAVVVNRQWGSPARMVRQVAVAGGVALGIALPVAGWFIVRVGAKVLIEDCHLLYTHLPAELIGYNARRAGLDHPLLSLLQMAGGGAVLVVALGVTALLAGWRPELRRRLVLLLALAVAVVVGVGLWSGGRWDGSPLRFMPVVLVGMVIASWRGSRRGDRGAEILFPVAACSLALLARVALRVPSGGAFGSFFLPVALILFCHLLIDLFPRLLVRAGGTIEAATRARRLLLAILPLVLAATTIVYAVRYRRLYSVEITTPRGHFFAPRSTGPALRAALDLIEARTRPGDSIVILPEGSELAFLTNRRMPLRHQIFIPGLMLPSDESRAVATLDSGEVRLLLLVNRPMREFGAESLGRDFYPALGSAIGRNYRHLATVGETTSPDAAIGDPRFFIRILEFAGGPPTSP